MRIFGKFTVGCLVLLLSGCFTTSMSTETSKAICDAWEDTLFLPSRADTEETAQGLSNQPVIHKAACKKSG